MSDDPSRYRFGVEEPLPWLMAAMCAILAGAVAWLTWKVLR